MGGYVSREVYPNSWMVFVRETPMNKRMRLLGVPPWPNGHPDVWNMAVKSPECLLFRKIIFQPGVIPRCEPWCWNIYTHIYIYIYVYTYIETPYLWPRFVKIQQPLFEHLGLFFSCFRVEIWPPWPGEPRRAVRPRPRPQSNDVARHCEASLWFMDESWYPKIDGSWMVHGWYMAMWCYVPSGAIVCHGKWPI